MHELGRVRLLDDCYSPSLTELPLTVSSFSPLVPSHGTASVQILRDLCLPHFLLHLYRADSRVTKVSACGSPLGFSSGTSLLAHDAYGCEEMVVFKQRGYVPYHSDGGRGRPQDL